MAILKTLPTLALSGVSLCLLPALAHSQTPTGSQELEIQAPAYRLDPLVVTPTLTVQTAGESLSSVTVIDEQDIRRQQPREFKQLLLGQPGVDLTANGAFGKNTTVYTRGTSSESTVLLIDGIRLRSATSGSAPWAYVPPQLLERIEIVRGPRSSLYGADAVGGVIQAFTHSAAAEPEGWVSLGGGSFNTQQASAGVAGAEGRLRYSVSANHFETDGTEIVREGEDKAYRNTSGVARLSHRFDNGGEAGVLLVRAQGNTEFEGGETDFAVQTLGLFLEAPVSEYWISGVQFAESLDEQDTEDAFGESVFDTQTRSARWQNTFFAGPHQFVAGAELMVDSVDSTTNYEEGSRTNTAVFGQALLDFNPVDVQFSLRSDDNEAYGRHETGAVALGLELDDAHRVRMSYGTSFRAPTFNDLYFPPLTFFGTTYAPNPDLDPEQASTYEIGVSGHYDSWFWDAAVYQTDVEDLISLSLVAPDVFAPSNVNEARIRGIELSSGFVMAGWTVGAALSWLDPEDRETGNRLRRRSAKLARLDLDRVFGDFSVGASVKAQGHRYDDAANEDRIPGFATLDLRAGWQIAENWSSRVTVENVLDNEYATARRSRGTEYISAGLTAFASVRYDFR